jgi:hypothetical protein
VLLGVLGRSQLPGDIPIQDLQLGVDSATIRVALLVSFLTALAFGPAPALQTSTLAIAPREIFVIRVP